MPAILRIFVYQTDASLTVIGSKPSYDQGVGRFRSMVCLQHYAVTTWGLSREVSVFNVLGVAE